MTFSEEIFPKNSRELNKFIISNNQFKLNSESELKLFTTKNLGTMTEMPPEEIIDTLESEDLRSLLKANCRTIQNLDDKIKSLSKNFINLIKGLCRS